jgi:hypothetical protein
MAKEVECLPSKFEALSSSPTTAKKRKRKPKDFLTQGLKLPRPMLYHLAILPAFFALVIFEIRSHFIARKAWIAVLLFGLPCVARMTGAYYYTQSSAGMGCKHFSPG